MAFLRVSPFFLNSCFSIVIFAALLRFSALGDCPAGLFRDEAEKGYNAYALATDGGVIEFSAGADGRAVMGWKAWPYVVDVMGVKTSVIYQYVSVPFVRAMGLSVASTRMAAALAGTLTVALLGLLLLRLWDPLAAVGALAWLALCPWHVIFSRWALQGIFVPLGMVGVLAGLAGAERRRSWGFPLAGAALGFVFYAYSGAQPFALAWGLALAILYRKTIVRQPWACAAGVALFLIGAAPRMWITAVGGGAGRLNAVAIWTQEGVTPATVFVQFVRNYAAHFNPVFLFISGDSLPRHGIPGFGQLLLIDAILLPVGLWSTFQKRMPLRGALLTAFLLGPIGAAITREGIPHALRSLPMVLPAAVWGGVGLVEAARWIRGHTFTGATRRREGSAAPSRGATLLAWIMVATAGFYAIRVQAVYQESYRNDRDVRTAFSASERGAFETVRRDRQPGENVWVSGAIAYAPYFILFYNRLPAIDTALKGLESEGFTVYPPIEGASARIRGLMRPGDWMIDFDPVRGEAEVWRKGM